MIENQGYNTIGDVPFCKYHSQYMSADIYRAHHADGRPRMHYVARIGDVVLCARNLSGIREAVRDFRRASE